MRGPLAAFPARETPFRDFTERGAVASLYDFENQGKRFFRVHASQEFCLLSLVGKAMREPTARFAFLLLDTADLDDTERVFALSPEEIALINPNTGTLPVPAGPGSPYQLAPEVLLVMVEDGSARIVDLDGAVACAVPESACWPDLLIYARRSCSSASSTSSWSGCWAGWCS